jgi:hypothetical protein
MWHHYFMVEVIIDRAAIIKLLRTQLDLGQHQLGVNKGTVNLLEKRKRKTDEDSLNKITKRLGVTLRYIDDVVDILNGRLQSAQLQREIRYCKEHEPEMLLLEKILHGTRKDANFWKGGIIANLHAMSKSATEPEDDAKSGGSSPAPKGQHGPGKPADDLGTGTPISNKARKKA